MFECVYMCVCVCLYVYLFVCMHACVYVCMYSCMHTCMCVFVRFCVESPLSQRKIELCKTDINYTIVATPCGSQNYWGLRKRYRVSIKKY